MRAGHQELVTRRNYHSMVGAHLSKHCSDVELLDGKGNDDGVLWSNRLCGNAGDETARAGAGTSADTGAQTEGVARPRAAEPADSNETAFTARMRQHQSWYREVVLQLPPGTGPHRFSTTVRGSMLRPEHAQQGRNFLTPEVYRVAQERLRRGARNVESFRLLHNMLSSQPMCFNLFAPLRHDLELATLLLRATPELGVDRVTAVDIEFAPRPVEEYLADGTSFDAYIEYTHCDGSRAFLGIETKLTDGFSRTVCDTPAYRRWMQGSRNPWLPSAALRVADASHNQLWRDHLLAIAMRDHPSQRYRHGALMLVRHPLDQRGAESARDYRRLLRDGDTSFLDMPMDQLVGRWRTALGSDDRSSWLRSFEERYLELTKSREFADEHA